MVLFNIRFCTKILVRSSSIRFPGRAKCVKLVVVRRHLLKFCASDIFMPNMGLSYCIPTCLAPYVNLRKAKLGR